MELPLKHANHSYEKRVLGSVKSQNRKVEDEGIEIIYTSTTISLHSRPPVSFFLRSRFGSCIGKSRQTQSILSFSNSSSSFPLSSAIRFKLTFTSPLRSDPIFILSLPRFTCT
ncbi:hypothetical protein RJT34_32918 [Clitoria ternatea]|uniref:Uncharacterized protein n=1 Tax=Clitoria ternatea TaxID=43366 RepID=A0AAN9I6C9_CLITE